MSAKRSFNGRVVVITGAAGGIGRALSQRFARAGARLALLDLNQNALDDAASELEGTKTMTAVCDVTDPEQVERATAQIVEKLGGIDVLINNAGAVHRSAFADTDVAVFRKVMEVNFFGSLYCAKAALDSLKTNRGLIIVISSVAGLVPLFGRSGYSASKHALHGLFESARAELLEDGVGLLMVCPGFTRSGFEQAALGADGKPAGSSRSMVGKLAEPSDVADSIFKGAVAGKRMLVMSSVGKLSALLSRLAPATYERMMVKKLRGELGG
jgi:NAD(P)-dependent dehydrogenase (short-subunit alcohol dehydrogenase family)